ncbi:conserved hypothetical protein [Lebetimonas natsushimae]|uniref:DUF3108 domain-containing protein n=1 Tax=Lebetimonas natsushimae TaxID=1936991 RepID=A0A292YAG7_9BACT|nr:DUF3108 domain-containing protein [Lebetimonas natsushimae]GAX86718.1 conserved hypothetical protein [Lebetimonas natsushimae]
MRYILLFFLIISVNAKTLIAIYEAKYGIFGTIATAKGIFERNATNYKIDTTVKTKGLAAALTKHMVQKYTSIGIIKNNMLIPLKYITYRKKGNKEYKRIYYFDHKNKIIIRKKYFNNKFDGKEKFDYYAPQDVLSLYFNLPHLLKNKKTYTFFALGARKSDGRVDVNFCKKNIFNEKGICIKGNLYNKVFAGDRGIVYLLINPNNWVTLKGIVKNVLKIGDLKGKIIYFKQVP